MAGDRANLRVVNYKKAGTPEELLGIRPTFHNLGITDVKGRYEYNRHQHLHYEIIAVDRGSYRCRLNESLLELSPGEVLVVKPGDWHQDLLEPPTRYFALSLRLTPKENDERSADLFVESVSPAQQTFRADRRVFWPVIRRIQRESLRNDAVSAQIQDALMLEFFWRLIRALPKGVVSPQFLRRSADEGFVLQLKRLFRERVRQSPDVEELAAALRVSSSSLTQKCRAILNLPPAKAFMRFKMERARALLEQTGMAVKEIAFELGFKNQFHFSRVFKKYHGESPSHLRE